MQFINYFFASIISFSGLILGIILTGIAPEEQIPLKKYFYSAKLFFLLLIFFFITIYYYNKLFYILMLIFGLSSLLFIEIKKLDILKISIFNNSILGILFFLSSINIRLFTLTSSFIFLYWLVTAPLIYNVKQKNYFRIILYNLIFILISNALIFVSR